MTRVMEVLNATEVRKNWSDFVDEVTNRNIPKVVARNNKIPFLSVSLEQVAFMLSVYRIPVTVVDEGDGTFTAEIEDFELFVNEPSEDEALMKLAHELIEYATDYMNDIQLYYSAPNRKKHFPYVMNVLLQENEEKVMELFDAHK